MPRQAPIAMSKAKLRKCYALHEDIIADQRTTIQALLALVDIKDDFIWTIFQLLEQGNIPLENIERLIFGDLEKEGEGPTL